MAASGIYPETDVCQRILAALHIRSLRASLGKAYLPDIILQDIRFIKYIIVSAYGQVFVTGAKECSELDTRVRPADYPGAWQGVCYCLQSEK